MKLKGQYSDEHLNQLGGNVLQRSAALADQYRHGLVNLRDSGWIPDVVISHSGWGCGLHPREIWPECHHVAYLEWWFDPQSEFFNYDPENKELNLSKKQASSLWLRNQALSLELISADAIVAPTSWQANQLPKLLRERCFIIHDGVDLERFRPPDKYSPKAEKVLTYGTRGMEPMRGFPQFIRSLPALLQEDSNVRIEIAGEDQANYGGRLPKNFSSWGQWAKNLLAQAGIGHRIHWMNYLDPEAYVAWLQRSDCHVYLTHPFVASWSLLEALACQTPLVASDVAPVRELCTGVKSTVVFADHRNIGSVTKAMQKCLEEGKKPRTRNEEALRPYSKSNSLSLWGDVAGLQLTTNH